MPPFRLASPRLGAGPSCTSATWAMVIGLPPRTVMTELRRSSSEVTRPRPVTMYSWSEAFQHAARQVQVGRLDGLDDLLQREVVRLEPARRHDHLVLLDAAADADHRGDARHGQQAVADVPLADGAQVELGYRAVVALVGEAVLQQAAHDRRHRQHDGRLDAGRKLLLGLPEPLGDLLARHGEIGAPLEHRHDGGQPDDGGRAHADHVGRAVQRRLDGQREQRFHLFRREARRLGQDDHLRRREVREHVEVDVARRHDAGDGGDDNADHHHQPVLQGPLNESAEHGENQWIVDSA